MRSAYLDLVNFSNIYTQYYCWLIYIKIVSCRRPQSVNWFSHVFSLTRLNETLTGFTVLHKCVSFLILVMLISNYVITFFRKPNVFIFISVLVFVKTVFSVTAQITCI